MEEEAAFSLVTRNSSLFASYLVPRTSYLKRLSAQSWFWFCTSYDGEGVLFVGGFVVDDGACAVGFEFDGEAFAVFGRFACVVLYGDVGGVDGVANYAPFAFGVSDYENARSVLH